MTSERTLHTIAKTIDHSLLHPTMRAHCPPSIQIKAAGGVRSLDDLLRVCALGVTRIGATTTEAILEAARARGFPLGPHGSTAQSG